MKILISFVVFSFSVGAWAAPILRVVEDVLPAAAAAELQQHRSDLEAEGWRVDTVFTPTRESKAPYTRHFALARDVIWPWIRTNQGGPNPPHILLIGAVPVPSTGQTYSLTEMPVEWGALPSVAYYALPEVEWTDRGSNTNYAKVSSRVNLPGDGWLDQQSRGSNALQAAIGVIDFSRSNPKAWGSALDTPRWQIECYRRYFRRLHAYRSGQWTFKTTWGSGDWRNSGRSEGFNSWAATNLDGAVRWFVPTNRTEVLSCAPFVVWYDFKLLPPQESFWQTVPDRWAFLDLSFGSAQALAESPRVRNPLVAGALLSASRSANWDLDLLLDGRTAGELWVDTVTRTPSALHLILLGDPTLRFRR